MDKRHDARRVSGNAAAPRRSVAAFISFDAIQALEGDHGDFASQGLHVPACAPPSLRPVVEPEHRWDVHVPRWPDLRPSPLQVTTAPDMPGLSGLPGLLDLAPALQQPSHSPHTGAAFTPCLPSRGVPDMRVPLRSSLG